LSWPSFYFQPEKLIKTVFCRRRTGWLQSSRCHPDAETEVSYSQDFGR